MWDYVLKYGAYWKLDDLLKSLLDGPPQPLVDISAKPVVLMTDPPTKDLLLLPPIERFCYPEFPPSRRRHARSPTIASRFLDATSSAR
jgi:hypothetical protein